MPDHRDSISERLRSFWRRPARDVADELQFHLEMRIEEARQAGMSEEEARAAALERFGEYHRVRGELLQIDTARERRREQREWLGDLERDVTFALRALRRAPAFACAAIATLAIAIGANTAIYSVVHAMLLAPLPFARPEQLVVPWGGGLGELEALRERWHSAKSIAAARQLEANFEAESVAERLSGAMVSDSFFVVLGVGPQLGRTFTVADHRPAEAATVILSHGTWRRRFGADRSILGRSILVEGKPRTVIGVMPKRFAFPSTNVSFWIPVQIDRTNAPALWTTVGYVFVARLRDGISLDAASAELSRLAPRLRPLNPVWDPGPLYGTNATAITLRDALVGETRTILRVVMGCAVLVLLIACINVANLLLARATVRERELAVRAALGGGRRRLVRQLLTESVVLSALGAAGGVALAAFGVRWLVATLPGDVPGAADIAINAPALGLALALGALTGIAFGALPAIRATRPGATGGLVRAGRGARGAGHQRVSAMLVAGEIALAVLVVTSAELLVRSFRELRRLDPGFRTTSVVTVRVTPTAATYGDPPRGDALFETLMARLAGAPGVKSVALVNALPLERPATGVALRVQGRFEDARQTLPFVNHLQIVTPAYFSVLGIPIRQGRGFSESDRRDGAPVAVVSADVARALWPGQDPIGKRIAYPYASPWMTVIGVVADVKSDNLRDTTVSAVYVPFLQRPLDPSGRSRTDFTIIAQTRGDAIVTGQTIRDVVTAVDRSIPTGAVRTMAEVVSQSVGSARFTMSLVSGFAFVALVLGAIGIYGVMSYLVGQRAQELSVRTALGATTFDLQRMVLGRAAGLAIGGAAAGMVLALLATQPLRALLYGISSFDPFTLSSVPLLFLLVALGASFGPARRASRVSPASALRAD